MHARVGVWPEQCVACHQHYLHQPSVNPHQQRLFMGLTARQHVVYRHQCLAAVAHGCCTLLVASRSLH